MKKKRRILVTGAGGFIGSNLVTCLDNIIDFKVFRGFRSVDLNCSERDVLINLADVSSILRLCENYKFDVIVHLAAKVGWGNVNYHAMYVENVLSTGALGYVADKMGAYFLLGSAALVHGQSVPQITLDTPISLETDYIRTKYNSEKILKSIVKDPCILRIGGVFGKDGPKHLHLNESISNALNGISPTLSGSGMGLRNYIYIKDLCENIIYAVTNSLTGTYLIGGTENTSIKTMLQIICEELLNNQKLIQEKGVGSARHQTIITDQFFMRGRSFRQSITDIREEHFK